MKLSRKFVSEYINLEDISINQIADDMTNVGNEYDDAGKLINATNLIIGEVVECGKHPDSDHLNVTKVNIGSDILDIVCGAPNCRKGLKVIVAQVGAKLPEIDIKESVIRGQKSCGMLCSLAELGIESKFLKDDDYKGIYELGLDAVVGEDPIKYLELDDEVIDFELTSNRGDLLSILGMAYELGAIYKKEVKDINLNYSEVDTDFCKDFTLDVQTEDCPLFLTRKVMDVQIKESPLFIKNRLIASGIRPINNVVDISNYVMLETGQPLHFYDADRLGNKLIVRNACEGEKLTTLDNIDRTLSTEDIVISDDKKAVGLAGVMGGLLTEVENDTKNIIIESALFNSVKVRKTSKKILRSEASNRFEKGIDYKRTYMAMERSLHLLEKYASAKICKGLVLHNNVKENQILIEVNYNKANKVLGLNIDSNEINNILKSLAFEIKTNENNVTVIVPSRRMDLKIEEDIIEEIGRIYGIDKIEGKLPKLSASVGYYNKFKREVKNKMVSYGLNESLSHSLIPEDMVNKYTTDVFEHINLADPMSEEKKTLRYSLIYSLKEVFLYNKARNLKDVSIFELGKGFYKNETYNEELKLAALMSGNYHLGINKNKLDFYYIKGIVENLLNYLGYVNRYSFVVDNNISNEFHPGQSASIIVQGNNVGVIGKIHPKELKEDVFVFEINLDKLQNIKASKMSFKEISKYPSISKDMAFVVKKDVTAGTLEAIIKKAGGKLLTNIEIFDVYVGENVGVDEKSIAYSLTFADVTKTLSDEEVMNVFNKIIDDVTNKCNAVLRDK